MLLSAVACVAAAGCSSDKPAGASFRVAAASDLSRAFDELGRAFTARTGLRAVVDFNSSGLLAKQIEQGAPYGLFLAANQAFADQAARSGKCEAGSEVRYARGHLVAWTRTGHAPATLAELVDPKWRRIAIANPDHAPYGTAAKQALVKAGIWDMLGSRVVVADSVQAAMTWAREGSAEIALVSMSLASVDAAGKTLVVDDALFDPLEQTLVVCGTGADAAGGRALSAFILAPEGREILGRYGFSLGAPPPAATP